MSDIRDFCPLWGEWEADQKLGEGSFGAVWKVKRNVVGGRVYYAAVKHISIPRDEGELDRLTAEGAFSNENSAKKYYNRMLQSIADEIDAMHKLQGYTNIVAYEDHKVIPKEIGIGYDLFLRMELLTPLTDRIRKGISVADVVALGKDIATAINVLYNHKMIHRDIKPQNIFVNDIGVYKLGDYGTARALGSGATAMSRKGTFNYMSPEIYNGWKADIRADIYSLGLVLYRLLNSNRLPFLPLDRNVTGADSDQALMRRMSGDKFPAPKNADAKLAKIVLKACAFSPDERYSTPDEMIRDLEKYRGNSKQQIRDVDVEKPATDSHQFVFEKAGGTGPKPEPVREQPAGPDNRKKTSRWLVPLTAVLVIGLAAGILWGTGIIPSQPAAPEETLIVTVLPETAEALIGESAEEPAQEQVKEMVSEPGPQADPVPASEPVTVKGDHWVLDAEGILTIQGNGRMEDIAGGNPWLAERARIQKVVIEQGIVNIGNSAFKQCQNLESVVIPDSVSYIGNYAFEGCSRLKDIEIPGGVTYIGASAFSDCSSLNGISIPDGVTMIGVSAFRRCSGLTAVVIPGSVTYIGASAFSGCSSVREVTLPASLSRIDSYVFYGCTALSRIRIPEGVTEIKDYAFGECPSLLIAAIPGSVSAIGTRAFMKDIALTVNAGSYAEQFCRENGIQYGVR